MKYSIVWLYNEQHGKCTFAKRCYLYRSTRRPYPQLSREARVATLLFVFFQGLELLAE